MPERRTGTTEIRVAGRTLHGTVIRYGDVSLEHRERFEPGVFHPFPPVPLNLQHDPDSIVAPAGSYQLHDSAESLGLRGELPAGSAALSLVRRGALNGFSVEFRARQERRDEAGLRVIEKAELVAIGLVDVPSYPGSTAEVRRRGDRGGRLGTYRGSIPTNRQMECRCGPGDCLEALFEEGAFGDATSARGRDILAVVGEYSSAIQSKRRGGVRFWSGKDGRLEYAVDIPNTERGRALMETGENVDLLARPVIDSAASKFTRQGPLVRYQSARIRALTIGPTDAATGWTPLRLRTDADDDMPDNPEPQPAARRRAKLWL